MQPIVLEENHTPPKYSQYPSIPKNTPKPYVPPYNYHPPTSPPYQYTTPKPYYTTQSPPNFINMNAVNSYTSMGTNPPVGQVAYTRRPMVNSEFGLGKPTGAYDPKRPDGPDYGTASVVPSPSHTYSKNPAGPAAIPLNIGLDVYPLEANKRLHNRKTEIEDNMHQVKLHLNLFSSKPAKEQGQSAQTFSIGPFSYNG